MNLQRFKGMRTENLLFFTDGRFVWDANHDLVNTNPNDTMSANPSAQRGALIVPDPANNNRYYIFYSPGDQFSPSTECTRLRIQSGKRNRGWSCKYASWHQYASAITSGRIV